MTHEFPYVSKTLDRDGIAMAYVDEGSGSPVLMVHGNPTWSFYFRRVIAELKDGYRCIAPDHIGCGRSDKPDAKSYPFTLTRRIDDLEALVDHLEIPPVTLIVHDWGGPIGLGWATRHPERVARIVLLNTAAFFLTHPRGTPLPIVLARVPGVGDLLVRGANAFLRGAIRYCTTRGPLPPAVAESYLEPFPTWNSRLAILRFVQDIPLDPKHPSFAVLDEIADRLPRLRRKPIRIAWGMKDFVFDSTFLEEWERRFPEALVHRFDDCGHFILEDAGDEIAPAIRDFIVAEEATGSP